MARVLDLKDLELVLLPTYPAKHDFFVWFDYLLCICPLIFKISCGVVACYSRCFILKVGTVKFFKCISVTQHLFMQSIEGFVFN